MFGWFQSKEARIRKERKKNDVDEIIKNVHDRQKEAEMFGGTWTLNGAIFPSRKQEEEYHRYLSKKMFERIKQKNPEFYEAMQRINDGYPLVLDTQKKTFYSEGWEDMEGQTAKEIIQQGYSDAYFGKDNSCKYSDEELEWYLEGVELFWKEFEIDAMKELNG